MRRGRVIQRWKNEVNRAIIEYDYSTWISKERIRFRAGERRKRRTAGAEIRLEKSSLIFCARTRPDTIRNWFNSAWYPKRCSKTLRCARYGFDPLMATLICPLLEDILAEPTPVVAVVFSILTRCWRHGWSTDVKGKERERLKWVLQSAFR